MSVHFFEAERESPIPNRYDQRPRDAGAVNGQKAGVRIEGIIDSAPEPDCIEKDGFRARNDKSMPERECRIPRRKLEGFTDEISRLEGGRSLRTEARYKEAAGGEHEPAMFKEETDGSHSRTVSERRANQ